MYGNIRGFIKDDYFRLIGLVILSRHGGVLWPFGIVLNASKDRKTLEPRSSLWAEGLHFCHVVS